MKPKELRELDAWLAEHVMGARRGDPAKGEYAWIYPADLTVESMTTWSELIHVDSVVRLNKGPYRGN